jgi:tetratricopeptide (TPR) repeat protein
LGVPRQSRGFTQKQITLRLSGAEYPWGTPDGFSNSVLAMLQHLIDRDPLSDEAKYAGLSLARGLMKQKEWKLALDYLSQAKIEPNRSGVCPGTVLYYQGRCYEEIGDRTQAESYYTRAKEFAEATLGTPDGLLVRACAEQRIQALKKLSK